MRLKIWKSVLAVVFLGSFALSPLSFGQESLPQWCEGDGWNYRESYVINGRPGTWFKGAEIQVPYLNYKYVRQETVTLTNSGTIVPCYVLDWNATIDGTGHMDFGPLTNLNIRAVNVRYRGSLWVYTGSLATVKRYRYMDGNVEWETNPGQWSTVGPLHVTVTEEYDQPLDYFRWPMSVGNFQVNPVTIYLNGTYDIPIEGAGTFNFDVPFNFSHLVQDHSTHNGFDTYFINTTDSRSTAYHTTYYGTVPEYFTEQNWYNMDFPDWYLTMTEAHFTLVKKNECRDDTPTPGPTTPATATPTRTQTPTATPVPTNTETPSSVPTDTPIPSPTPTRTPLAGSAPSVALGGYWNTRLARFQAGTLTLLALVTDPDGDILSVELGTAAGPSGIFLYDDGAHGDLGAGDGFYGFTSELPVIMTPVNMALEVVGRDTRGRASRWPFLVVR